MRRPFSGGEGARGRTRAVLAVGVLALCAVAVRADDEFADFEQPAGSAAPRAPSSGAAAEVEVSSPGAASSRGKYALGSEHQPKLVVQLCTS